jgi:SAM-dependent methyltransferase
MDYITEIEQEYLSQANTDFSFLTKHGIVKTEVTSLMLLYDNCKYNSDEAIHFFVKDYLKKPEILDDISPDLTKFYDFYINNIFCNIKRLDFINKSAHIYLNAYRGNPEIEKFKITELYKPSQSGTKFVDLLSGFNFIHFLDRLDSKTAYYLIDKSIFTCECLKITIEKKELSNVFVINKDIRDIEIDDIGDDISVIRANNIWCYIQDFHNYIQKYKSFLIKNGVFLFQEYSVNNIFNMANNPYLWLDDYFGSNWEKEFVIQKTENIRAFDSFIYRRIF